jgi:hypothetical protein
MTGLQMVILGIGCLALLAGALIALMRFRTIVGGAKAEGRIVDVTRSSGGVDDRGRAIAYVAPVVEFRHGGKTYRFTSSMGIRDAEVRRENVTVRFLPSDPQSSAEIDTPVRMWGFPVMALLFGGIFVALALYADWR